MFFRPCLLLTLVFALSSANRDPRSLRRRSQGCATDLLVIIDNSGSVGEVFQQEKEVAAKLIDSLPVSPTAVRVALVDFNSKAETVFSFTQYADNTAVSSALRSLNASGGSTNVVEALNAANQEFTKARPNVKKVLLIITDGQSQNTIEMINQASAVLNSSGVEVFAASASDQIGQIEFDLYTVNHRERIFLKNNVTSLPDSVGKFVAGGGSCGAPPPDPYVKPSDKPIEKNDKKGGCKTDLIVVLDNSGSVQDVFVQEKDTAGKLVESLDVSPLNSRVSLVQFNTDATNVFSFSQYATKEDVAGAIRNTTAIGGTTNTVEGLKAASKEFQKARSDVNKILLLITDGNSQNTIESLIDAVKLLTGQDAIVFAASASDSVGFIEFDIFSEGHHERTFLKNNLTQLVPTISKLINSGECRKPDAPVSGDSANSSAVAPVATTIAPSAPDYPPTKGNGPVTGVPLIPTGVITVSALVVPITLDTQVPFTPPPLVKSSPQSPGTTGESYAVVSTAAPKPFASTPPPEPTIIGADTQAPIVATKITPGIPGNYGQQDIKATTVGGYKESGKFRERLDDLKPLPNSLIDSGKDTTTLASKIVGKPEGAIANGRCPQNATVLPDGRFKANLDDNSSAQTIQILHCERDSQCLNNKKCCSVTGVWGLSTICVTPENVNAAVNDTKNLRGSRKTQVALTYLAYFLDNILMTIVVPIIPDVLYGEAENRLNSTLDEFVDLPTEDMRIGLIFATKPFIQLFANPLVSYFATKYGYNLIMFAGNSLFIASSLVFTVGTAFWIFIFARVLHGIGSSCSLIAGMAMLSDAYPDDKERSAVMGVALGGMATGVLFGYPLGGIMYEYIGRTSPFFLVASMITLVEVLQCIVLQPAQNTPSHNRQYILGIAERPIHSDMFRNYLCCHHIYCHIGTLSTDMAKINDTSKRLASCFGYLLGTNIFGFFSLKIGRWLCSLLSMIIIGLSLNLIPFATHMYHLIIPHFGIGLGVAVIDASLMPMLAHLVDERHAGVYGTVFALSQTTVALAYFIGPFFGGWLISMIGFPWLLRCLAIVNLAMCPMTLFLRKFRDGPETERLLEDDTVATNLNNYGLTNDPITMEFSDRDPESSFDVY